MINIQLVHTLLNSASIRTFLGVLATLGFAALLDFFLVLEFSILVGPWITMGVIAALNALGIFLTYRIVEVRRLLLTESITRGRFDESLFTAYITGLIAGLFLMIPGVVNSALGAVMLIPAFSKPLGNRLIRPTGIDWAEAYEYLRLDRAGGYDTES